MVTNADAVHTLLSLFPHTETGFVIHVHAAEPWEYTRLQWALGLWYGPRERVIIALQQGKGSGYGYWVLGLGCYWVLGLGLLS